MRPPALAGWLAGLAVSVVAGAAELEPPGFSPRPPGVHALMGATLVPRPGVVLTNATLVVSNGLIAAVGGDVTVPAGARVWDSRGLTVYAGFIEPYHVVSAARPGSNPVGNSEVSGAADARPLEAGGTAGPRFFGVPGQESDPGNAGPGAGSVSVTPEVRAISAYVPEPKTIGSLRELGFTVAHVVPGRGIIRGQSVLVALGDTGPNAAVLASDVAQSVSFSPSPAAGGGAVYPASLMGVISLIRQTFLDADFHAAQMEFHAAHPEGRTRPAVNLALDALGAVRRGQSVFFEPGGVLMLDRARRLADELRLGRRVFVATGQEWRRPDVAAAAGGPYLVPLAFPALPKIPDDDGWEDVTLDQLRAWDWAPENPAVLRRANPGAELALTTHGLSERKEFRRNLALAIERGWAESDALAALTVVPAKVCGMERRAGTLEVGRLANLTVVEGSYFRPENPVRAVWVDGIPYELGSKKMAVATGTNSPTGGSTNEVVARVARSPLEGRVATVMPPAVLVRGATIWTSGPQGVLTNAFLLVAEGRVVTVGGVPPSLPHGTLEIDGAGMHVTPGLIDCHNHSMILGQVNEATLPSTAMVRVADVVNSETDNIHKQLAGGLTVANLLHGSANPIGGQNCVIKLREGAVPDGLVFERAPAGIKFALGENVKQSNWGERQVTRFPQTRMGVPTFFANRFTAAERYLAERKSAAAGKGGGAPFRRDLELEALAEIIGGTRLIHCHSYRQDEILAFLRTMESFGVRVATLQHILEGYKVADEIARHGAGASAFADWWGYKLEVIDAIPHAGSLMRERGVLVSFNSDSEDHARRLNLEAAKAVKYGGTPVEEALRFVTINPARQLKVDAWVGSLEPGKDGDFVLWSGDPLDSGSVCLQTWIEGRQYFDRGREPGRAKALREERDALLAKARKQAGKGREAMAGDKARERFFERVLEQARHLGVSRCQDCRLPMRQEDEP